MNEDIQPIIKQFKCLKCENKWYNSPTLNPTGKPPKNCPKCKSATWNKPRQYYMTKA